MKVVQLCWLLDKFNLQVKDKKARSANLFTPHMIINIIKFRYLA